MDGSSKPEASHAEASTGVLVLGVATILTGVLWLLGVKDALPSHQWVWTGCLGALGAGTFVASRGIDKASVILGPFLLAGCLGSALRHLGFLLFETEVPLLVILLGVLLLVARDARVRAPAWWGPPAR